MRRYSFVAWVAAALLFGALPSGALAQETPDEYADQWTEARRGDRDWKQRAVEQLTMGPMDRLFGPAADETMKVIINRTIDRIEAMYRERRDPCFAAAVNMAHYQVVLTTGRQEVTRGATEMLFSAAGGAAGGRNLAEFLGQRLVDQIKDKLQDAALDKFKEKMRDEFKKGLPQYYENDDTRGDCEIEFRIVWDKAAERYQFIVVGDCKCKQVSCGLQGGTAPLRRWTIEGWGTVIPEIEQLANGDKKVTFQVGAVRDVTITADCCRLGDNRIRVHPPRGTGNTWVGTLPQPATTPQPPQRPQTGGTPPPTGPGGTTPQQPATTPAPSGPPRGSIQIPDVPDRPMTEAELERLGESVQAAQQQAEDLHRRASSYLAELEDRQPPATEAEIRDAEAAVEEAGETVRRARAALDKVLDKFNQQQSSVPRDPASAEILATHNALRREVGAPALKWDPQLAANASVHAAHLARIGRLVHAPRETRGIERENLSQGMLGWGPQQMLRIWLDEKRNLVPGTFPNVSRTGRWEDVAHYTQMIWPTTTGLGCGMATGSGSQWLVCRYSPGGNKDGKPVGLRPDPRPERGR